MSAYALPDLFHTPCHFSFEEKESHNDDDDENDDFSVAVSDAKVDSALLLKSLIVPSTTTKELSPTSQRRMRKMRMALEDSPTTKPPTASSSLLSASPSAKDALKFELSISLNGRNYTAFRSLPSFELLRQNLLEEIGEGVPELCFEEPVQRPSLGFLQGILQSYKPTVERWLSQVIRRVSPTNSASLRSFLWEPLSRPEYLLHRHESCSSSQLDRIDETEFSETDEEM